VADPGRDGAGRLCCGELAGAGGGMLSESVYGRAWHAAAREAALGPELVATALAAAPMICGTPPCPCG